MLTNPTSLATPAAATVPSGAYWVTQFRSSAVTTNLRMPFRGGVESFIAAMRAAGATIRINSTFRDPRRAYLMHWSWRIVKRDVDPQTVPAMEGVAISWSHYNQDGSYSRSKSVAGASDMVRDFQIGGLGVAPALNSRHTQGCAIDMNIRWTGTLSVADANGAIVAIRTTPRTGTNPQLIQVGASYRVIKYNGSGRDDPHWSDTGR